MCPTWTEANILSSNHLALADSEADTSLLLLVDVADPDAVVTAIDVVDYHCHHSQLLSLSSPIVDVVYLLVHGAAKLVDPRLPKTERSTLAQQPGE